MRNRFMHGECGQVARRTLRALWIVLAAAIGTTVTLPPTALGQPAAGGAAGGVPPGFSTGSPGTLATGPPDASTWGTFRSEQFGFEVRYPSVYVLVESAAGAAHAGVPVFEVRLLDRALAHSPLANRAPAQFTLEVYKNPSREPLEAWLEARGFVPPVDRFGRSPARVGGVEGIRVTDRAQLAPNLYYFVAHRSFVYRLIPLGPLSDTILASVRFLGR